MKISAMQKWTAFFLPAAAMLLAVLCLPEDSRAQGERLVDAHPCVAYAESFGSSPPSGSRYYPFDATKSAYVQSFEEWLEQWKTGEQPPISTGHLVINEFVADPQNDWSTYDWNGGIGDGPVTDTDEFVELYNASDETLEIRGYVLEIDDTSPSTETLGTDKATLVFSEGSSLDVFLPGAFLVIGNPAGAINNSTLLELRDPDLTLVDAVNIDGNASSTEDEAVYRCVDGVDTDDDSDWCRGFATPGWDNGVVCEDVDGDGYVKESCGGKDCNDEVAEINPATEEVCDEIDNDCDGSVDEEASDAASYYPDVDGDGYGALEGEVESCTDLGEGYVSQAGDCDDGNGEANPDAEEVLDGLDNDCDGEIDEGVSTPTPTPTPIPGDDDTSVGDDDTTVMGDDDTAPTTMTPIGDDDTAPTTMTPIGDDDTEQGTTTPSGDDDTPIGDDDSTASGDDDTVPTTMTPIGDDDSTASGDDDTVPTTMTPIGDDDSTASGDDDTVPTTMTPIGDDDSTASGDDDTEQATATPTGDDDTSPGDDDTAQGTMTPPGDDDTSASGDDDTSASGDDDTAPEDNATPAEDDGGSCSCNQTRDDGHNLSLSFMFLAGLLAVFRRRRH